MASLNRPIRRRQFLTLLGGAAAGGGLLVPARFDRFLTFSEAIASPAGRIPLDDATARIVLGEARARGAEFADLFAEVRTVTRLNLSSGTIDSVEQGIFAGCGVRAVDGERTGYAYADSFEREPLVAAARDAAAIASGHGGVTLPESWKEAAAPTTVGYARSFDDVRQDERVAWVRRADEAARAYDPAVKQVTIEYSDEMLDFLIFNSDGLRIEQTVPLLMLRINVNAEKNGGRGTGLERLSHRSGAEQMDGDAAGAAGTEASRMAVAMCEAAEAPSGEMPVVLGSGGGVLFHEAVGHGLEGDGVRRGTSFYAGHVGETVGSERVSLYDTGAMPGLRGSYNVDDEGAPPMKNLLIEKGVLRGFLNDRITSIVLQAPRTGNGRRQSYRFPPLVRMSNTYLATGEDPPEEIIRQTPSGLYARALGGGEVDTTTGNFTFGLIEAYRIEGGKITSPVRGANLVGNGPEILKRIDRVGPDQKFWNGTCGKGQWVPVTTGSPTLRISAMTIGGSGQG
jgi:TldD protein